MTSDWKECKLKDVCIQITDGVHNTVIDNPNGNCYLLSCKNIKNGIIAISNQDRKIDNETLEKLRLRTKTQKDDVLLTSVGTIGETAIIKENDPKYEFQRSVAIFKPNKNIIMPKFLLYSLNNKKRLLQHTAEGAVQQCLFINPLKEFKVNLPPLETQQKIAKVLSSIDDKIELNNSINKNLEQQVKTLYDNSFNENRDIVNISDLIDVRDGTHDSPKPQEEGKKLITSKHLLKYGVDKSSANLISEEDYNKINERSVVSTNDILISMIGTVGIVSFIIENPVDFAVKNVGIYRTSLKPEYAYYVHCYLNSQEIQNYIQSHLAGTTQKYISLSELRTLEIKIPDKNELNIFNKIVKPLYENIIINTKENERLTQLRDTLLPKLMNGEIDVDKVEV